MNSRHSKYHITETDPCEKNPVIAEVQDQKPFLLSHYVIGFVGSLILTLSAYFITIHVHSANGRGIAFAVLALLAFTQFVLQLYFFLHVGHEFPPRFKLLMTSFMILVVCILVGGSLWIMYNLSNRVMPSQAQMIKYMNAQDNL